MDYRLITCIVERGRAERVADEALRAGAQGVTICQARGKGVRERLGLLGHLIDPEKEIVLVVTASDQADAIFDTITATARLEQPGKGFAFVQAVERVAGYMDSIRVPANGGSPPSRTARRATARRRPAPAGRRWRERR